MGKIKNYNAYFVTLKLPMSLCIVLPPDTKTEESLRPVSVNVKCFSQQIFILRIINQSEARK